MKPHVLMVDDDREEMLLLNIALAEVGIDCKCTWAATPQQALDMLRYLMVDLIFLDYRMPKMNGIECLEQIRQLPNGKDVRVILHSSQITPILKQEAQQLGATCLPKSHDLTELKSLLKELLFENLEEQVF